MAYYEGEIGGLGGYNNNGFGTGWEGIIGLALVASLFGGGWGFGGNRGGAAGSEFYGYQLGRTATSEDIASGFAQNTLQRGIDDIILGQAQMQNYINQGFSGINASMANCCCDLRSAIADVKYADERNTCNIITNQNANTQRILDYLFNEKVSGLTAENVALKGQLSNYAQTNAIVSALKPTPVPSYNVPNPNCCYTNTCVGIQ